jgi:hypothetical protein
MIALKGVIKNGQVVLPERADLPDGTEVEVLPVGRTAAEQGGWPPGFIEQTAGAWEGEFVVESEGPYEQREGL